MEMENEMRIGRDIVMGPAKLQKLIPDDESEKVKDTPVVHENDKAFSEWTWNINNFSPGIYLSDLENNLKDINSSDGNNIPSLLDLNFSQSRNGAELAREFQEKSRKREAEIGMKYNYVAEVGESTYVFQQTEIEDFTMLDYTVPFLLNPTRTEQEVVHLRNQASCSRSQVLQTESDVMAKNVKSRESSSSKIGSPKPVLTLAKLVKINKGGNQIVGVDRKGRPNNSNYESKEVVTTPVISVQQSQRLRKTIVEGKHHPPSNEAAVDTTSTSTRVKNVRAREDDVEHWEVDIRDTPTFESTDPVATLSPQVVSTSTRTAPIKSLPPLPVSLNRINTTALAKAFIPMPVPPRPFLPPAGGGGYPKIIRLQVIPHRQPTSMLARPGSGYSGAQPSGSGILFAGSLVRPKQIGPAIQSQKQAFDQSLLLAGNYPKVFHASNQSAAVQNQTVPSELQPIQVVPQKNMSPGVTLVSNINSRESIPLNSSGGNQEFVQSEIGNYIVAQANENHSAAGGLEVMEGLMHPNFICRYALEESSEPDTGMSTIGVDHMEMANELNYDATTTHHYDPQSDNIDIKPNIQCTRPNLPIGVLANTARYPQTKKYDGTKCIRCRLCGIQFQAKNKSQYIYHLSLKHAIDISEDEISPRAPTSTVFECKTCNELVTEDALELHRISCCPNVEVNESYKPYHGDRLSHTCGICETTYTSREELGCHLGDSHDEIAKMCILGAKDLRCAHCLRNFRDARSLTLHCLGCDNEIPSEETTKELATTLLRCFVPGCPQNGIHPTINEARACSNNDLQKLTCIICNSVMMTRVELKRHLQDYHGAQGDFLDCPFCHDGSFQFKDCRAHIINSHFKPIIESCNQVNNREAENLNRHEAPPANVDPEFSPSFPISANRESDADTNLKSPAFESLYSGTTESPYPPGTSFRRSSPRGILKDSPVTPIRSQGSNEVRNRKSVRWPNERLLNRFSPSPLYS